MPPAPTCARISKCPMRSPGARAIWIDCIRRGRRLHRADDPLAPGARIIIEPMPLDPHTRLGPYEILDLLGEGGMGEVYRGRDTRLGRPVAIKVVHSDFSARFESEARAISALNHPNICTLY